MNIGMVGVQGGPPVCNSMKGLAQQRDAPDRQQPASPWGRRGDLTGTALPIGSKGVEKVVDSIISSVKADGLLAVIIPIDS